MSQDKSLNASAGSPWLDYFSTLAGDYARYRPSYPAELFEYLAQRCGPTQLAWDCATGNGQAAVALAGHFERVWATDASAQQIAQAQPHPRVEYHCAQAQNSGLADASVDLVCVAQALHWFPLAQFYAEVQRVLRPGGWLAVWSYATLTVADPAVNAWVDHFYSHTLDAYWSPQRRWVEEGYRNFDFPFAEQQTPAFVMQREWDLASLAGYLGTWSATEKYRQAALARGEVDPFPAQMAALAQTWPDDGRSLSIHWPLNLRLGQWV